MSGIPRKLKKKQKKYLDNLTNITTYAQGVTTPTLTFDDLVKAMEFIKDYLPPKRFLFRWGAVR